MSAIASHNRSSLRRRVSLDQDRWVSIRPIERTDASGLSGFYAALSTESSRRRFLSYGRQVPMDLILTFAAGTGLVGILREAGPNDGAVVAHASVDADTAESGEVAFAVADDLQGRGIGSALMRQVVELARARGLRRLTAALFADNAPMRRILRNAGCEVVADEIDAGTEEITLGVGATS